MLAVLDTGPEPVFDALVRIAAAVCGTPIALISLIDESRQWFKANEGLAGVHETPREIAFCDHAIRGDELFEVRDATQDPRFRANPLVTGEPNIRFYAGAPIAMPSGERIGTLCVIDRRPGGLSPQQQAALQDLAQVARWALLQRERLHDLTVVGDESRFQAISYASPLGIFQADAQGALFHINGRGQELLGLGEERALGLGWQDAIVAEDRDRAVAAWRQAATQQEGVDTEFAVTRGEGRLGRLRLHARPGRWGAPPRSGFIGVIEDITERWEAERQQRTAYELLASVVAHLPCGLAVYDGDLHLVAHNREFETLLDLPAHLFAQPDLRLPDLVRFSTIRGDHGPGDVEAIVRETVHRARTGSGDEFQRDVPGGNTLAIRNAPLPDGGFVATFVDITPAQAAEQALRASEERQKRALDASRLALWDLDLRTGQLYLSENWSTFLGGPPVPTVTTLSALMELVPAEEQQALTQALVAAMKGESDRYAMDHRVRRLDGSWLWIHSEGRITKHDADGQALHATGTNQDITLRRASEQAGARAAAITAATLEATTDAILVVGAAHEILLYNRRFLEIWNIAAPPEGMRHEELAPVAGPQLKDVASYLTRLRAVYAAPDRESHDLLEFQDGRVFERYARPMALPDGTLGRVWSYRDITAERAADAEVRQAKEAAEAANRAKSDFLDNVSHEIRTPLNGVLGLTRLLLAEPLTPQQRKYVQLADHSASSLLELINDLLDLGKIESGRMELEDLPFRLDELVQHLGELYRLRAGEQGLRFVLDLAADVPLAVRGDAGRLRQILNNLLSNALKFSGEHGEFGLTVARVSGERADLLAFTVWDRGIGIPHDVQQRLFTRFTQADSSTSRKFGGTGLGLAIVKQLCEQMDGHVTLESAPGHGSSFRCELRLAVEGVARHRGGRRRGAVGFAGHGLCHARAGGRGQPDQPGGGARAAGAGRLPRGHDRRRRTAGAGRGRDRQLRPGADGLPHAAHGRLRSGAAPAQHRLHSADHRAHGQCLRRRAGPLPGLGHERVPGQADRPAAARAGAGRVDRQRGGHPGAAAAGAGRDGERVGAPRGAGVRSRRSPARPGRRRGVAGPGARLLPPAGASPAAGGDRGHRCRRGGRPAPPPAFARRLLRDGRRDVAAPPRAGARGRQRRRPASGRARWLAGAAGPVRLLPSGKRVATRGRHKPHRSANRSNRVVGRNRVCRHRFVASRAGLRIIA